MVSSPRKNITSPGVDNSSNSKPKLDKTRHNKFRRGVEKVPVILPQRPATKRCSRELANPTRTDEQIWRD